MLKAIQGFIQQVLGLILSILPDSPVRPFIDSLSDVEWLGVLNWFVPVGTLLSIGLAWTAAITIFYTFQIVLRWSRAVGD